jgi:hypothetical protein
MGAADGLNLRSEARMHTRLRSGKLFGRHKAFLTDCSIFDRSTHGARLRLFANIVLPERFCLYDDAAKQLYDAKVAWRRGQDVGVRLSGALTVCW